MPMNQFSFLSVAADRAPERFVSAGEQSCSEFSALKCHDWMSGCNARDARSFRFLPRVETFPTYLGEGYERCVDGTVSSSAP